MKVAVTGATGFIGRHLCATLLERKHAVVALTRDVSRAPRGTEPAQWDAKDAAALKKLVAGCDAAVNLAGEGIFNRKWDAEFKALIRSSRVECTKALVEACRDAAGPKTLVSASATGYYGPRGDRPQTEEGMGDQWNFLSSVCLEWEFEANKAEAAGVRVVIPRIGMVLGRDGGALEKMLPPFRAMCAGPIGKGEQYMSWVHIDDVCGLICRALEDPGWKGVYNATAPNPVTNREFSGVLARVLAKPQLIPGWFHAIMIPLMLGEVASLLTTGQNVVPKRALEAGYAFRFPELEPALRNLVGEPAAQSA
jgi:hypothetical protein